MYQNLLFKKESVFKNGDVQQCTHCSNVRGHTLCFLNDFFLKSIKSVFNTYKKVYNKLCI